MALIPLKARARIAALTFAAALQTGLIFVASPGECRTYDGLR
jgi:hypothetical protein